MQFQELVDRIPLSCAVFCVQKTEDGECKEIRTVVGNEAYKIVMEGRYRDGALYTELVPKNSSFEQFCFNAAILGRRLHNYVETITEGIWTDEIMLPLGLEGDKGYCLHVVELSNGKELQRRAAVSKNSAETLIRISINLMETEDFKKGLHDVLSDILIQSGAQSSHVYLLDNANRTLKCFCESIGPEGIKHPVNIINYDLIHALEGRVQDKSALIIADEDDRKVFEAAYPAWKSLLRKYDVKTLVFMPLRDGRGIYGYIDFVNFDHSKTAEIHELLELCSFFLGSAISNYLLIDRLEEMSTTDALTGLKNRNAMHRSMEELGRKPFGLVSLDLNGLKTVNDRDGHEAGDRLLVSAAEALKKTFYFDDIYRTGGDEFIVLIPDINRDDFYRKIERFQKSAGKNDSLHFAIGAAWSDGSLNVNMVFRCADERMYEDKNRYYEQHQELRRSSYDPLTGLPTVSAFGNMAEQRKKSFLDQGKQPALLYFNYNGMKLYNEKNGFAEGDRLLKITARNLESFFGADYCCRVGQDHFIVIADTDGLENRLREFFGACAHFNDGRTLPMSAGIYSEETGWPDFGTACDRAKYACDKTQNRFISGFCWFDAELLKSEENRQYIIDNLDQALENGWITVAYQPIIRSFNGHICEEEALARWNDPVRGTFMPVVFVPVLEEAKLIYKLDMYVLDQILIKMNDRKAAGRYVLPHSLNLSRVDFEMLDVVEEVRKRADAAGIERKNLIIEITESVMGQDFDYMHEQVLRFRELGFPVWMDDFGTGYSSLDLLQRIHFDMLKFDMHFLHQIDQNPTSRILLTELMKMASSLGIGTLTEGVETKEQADFLREIGCGRMQGYYFGAPLTIEQIAEEERKKGQTELENPAEAEYYSEIGRINLYDLTTVAANNHETDYYFSSVPMAVIEVDDTGFKIIRRNRSYQEFLQKAIGNISVGQSVAFPTRQDNEVYRAIRQCQETDMPVVMDEIMSDGKRVHGIIRRISVNPVTGSMAMVIAMLAVL